MSVVLDIDLPGRPSDIHAMQKDGENCLPSSSHKIDMWYVSGGHY